MRRLSPLTVFFLSAVGWIVVATAAWSWVAPYTSHPVAVLTHMALEAGAPDWIRTVHKSPGMIEVETRLQISVPGAARGVVGEVIVDATPARYSYGLPIFLALLLASRSTKMLRCAVVGYAALLPAQAFSLTFDLLKQIMVATQGNLATLGVARWQLEGIVFCYQLGALVLPTLVPIMLWLWLNYDFFIRTVATSRRSQTG